MKLYYLAAFLLVSALGGGAAFARPPLKDVLETPAQISPQALSARLMAVAVAGKSQIAVGQRGVILKSDGEGAPVRQVASPVSGDLVAVHFPSASQGWIVGHDGIILHSTDGGETWEKQLDGSRASEQVLSYYEAKLAAGDQSAADFVVEAKRIAQTAPVMSFMDVWFRNEREGYVVGAYNLIFKTVDGGRSWEPLLHLTENPQGLHLYSIRGQGDTLYVAGERGLVLRFDPAPGRFVAVETPYRGTYFGLAVSDDSIVVFGLQGKAFRSTDGGRSWHSVELPTKSELVAGTRLESGELVLVSQRGEVHVSRDDGKQFSRMTVTRTMPFYGVAGAGAGRIALVGARGLQFEAVAQ